MLFILGLLHEAIQVLFLDIWEGRTRTLSVPAALPAAGAGSQAEPRKFFAYYGLFGRFSLRKHDLSVCFSVHIIKVKPDEKQRFYGMDAYGCKET